MKTDTSIASIEAWACSVPLDRPLSFGSFEIASREYVAVRVATHGGLISDCLGLTRRAPIDVAVVDVVAPLVVGREALDIAARLQDIGLATRALDQEGVIGRARSLIEICLWDLRAQVAGLPLWRMLGGCPRQMPVLLVEGYALPDETDADFAERLAARVAEGYTAIKVEAASYTDPRRLATRLGEVRERVGEEVELVVDMAWSWRNARQGASAACHWSGYGLAWIEDPLPVPRAREIAKLRALLDTPVASGDEATRPGELIELLEVDAVDVLRLDATTIGGMGTVGELAARAEADGKRASMHVHPELHQHCSFAWPMFDHIEAFPLDRPFDRSHELLQRSFMEGVSRGCTVPPQEPGTGLQLDLDAVRRTAYRHDGVRDPGHATVSPSSAS